MWWGRQGSGSRIVCFDRNSAGVSGGAVFSKDTISFTRTSFEQNQVIGTSTASGFSSGLGGASYAIITGANNLTSVLFCSSSFTSNAAKNPQGSSLYLQTAWGVSQWDGKVAFCGGSMSSGTVVPLSGWQLVTGCLTSACNA